MPLAPDTNDRIEDFMVTLMRNMADEDAVTKEKFIKESGWVAAELEHWKQRCEELEIELECERNSFNRYISDGPINPVLRGKHEN
jgi:hypothetical protein